MAEYIGGMPVSPMVIMILIMLMFFIGGFFMDSMALIVVLIPILFPIVVKLGFDPIWFGVVTILLGEMGVITPPVGVNVFVIKGIAPEVPLEVIFRGIFPFLIALIIATIIITIFPQIATFLPGFMTY